MATKTVTGKFVTADGVASPSMPVRATLSADGAYITATGEVARTTVATVTASDGTFTLTLEANGDLNPANTYYTITIGGWTGAAIVPQTAGPFTLDSILVAPPAQTGAGALDSAVVHKALTETITGAKFVQNATPGFDMGADAPCDGVVLTDVSCTSGSAAITSASAAFTSADVGKLFDLYAGGIVGTQIGTIASVQGANSATLSTTANHNATNANLVYFTDSTTGLNTWAARGNNQTALRTNASGLAVITGTVTFPAKFHVEGGSQQIWVSSRIGSSPALDISAALANSRIENLTVNVSLGATGQIIRGVGGNEAGTLMGFRNVNIFSPNDGADYLVFLQAMVGTFEHCDLNANNKLSNKCLAHSAVISASEIVDCNLIGRVYTNAQAYAVRNCTTGPIRAANNSAADGSGSAQQTNTLTIDGTCYVYSSTLSGTDYPCIESVVASTAGEGAAGGCFPNLNIAGSYLVMGAGASTGAQAAISGNLAASQGGVSIVCDGVGFQQSSSSPATTMYLVQAKNGAGAVFIKGGGANIVSGVTTAKIFNLVGGTTECVLSDFYPSGQATVWQHPFVSSAVGVLTAWPVASTVGQRNTGATAYEVFFQEQTGSPITAIAMSSDNSTYVTIWSGGGSIVKPTNLRWPPGVWLKVTFASTAPNYIIIPCP